MRSQMSAGSIMPQRIQSRIIIRLVLSILAVAGIQLAFGADFWETKDYRQWSEKECAKMLTDSPWSKEYRQSRSIMSPGTSSDRDMAGEQDPFVSYQMQFRSSLPVRRAIVRQNQILQKYESLPAEQKQQFDQWAKGLLEANFDDAVVLSITYRTNVHKHDQELARHWQSRTTDLLATSVYLSGSKGNKVPIASYAVAQGAQREFQFIFPRRHEGKEILGPDDKALQLEFAYPVVGGIGDGRGFIEFKTNKMLFDGKIAY